MAFRDSLRQPHSAGRLFIALAMTLLLTAVAAANVLRVPSHYASIQEAMDFSMDGDTVIVGRGTWAGLLESPAHSLTLASQFLLSGDTTDVTETILDAEYEGTLLTVNTEMESGIFHLYGLTLEHGQGQGENSVCLRAGAIHVSDNGNLTVRSSVIRNNVAPIQASAIFFALDCTIYGSQGTLHLENVYFENNQNDVGGNPGVQHGSIYVRSQQGIVELRNIRYNGSSATINSPIRADIDDPRTFAVDGLEIWDCDGGAVSFILSSDDGSHYTIQNVKTYTTNDTLGGCSFGIGASGLPEHPFTLTTRNIEISGVKGDKISMGGSDVHFRYSGIHVHHCSHVSRAILGIGLHSAAGSSEIRDLVFHHNTSGDSVDQVPEQMILLGNTDVFGAHVYDNHVIIPPDPLVSEWGGNFLRYGSILNSGSSAEHLGDEGEQRFEDLFFENNFVDDLDDYSNLHPAEAPHENEGRELCLRSSRGLAVSNLTILNSRQPNHTPELYAPTYMTFSTSGSCAYLEADSVWIDGAILEDCDDGGLHVRSYQAPAVLKNISLRNVGRTGIRLSTVGTELQNVLIENVDAVDNFLYLTPQNIDETEQSAIYGLTYQVTLENVTVTGCDEMRRPFGFFPGTHVDIVARNSLIADNTYEMLLEGDYSATWSHCYVQEAVEGEGNLLGNDPLFDPERGIPFLAPDSPCIDAGNPDAAYNDIEDPDAPGFALWPSQGSLRNDIGCTGGPYANDSMFVSVAPSTPITLPTSPALGDAYPNPFNPTTTIPFVIHYPTHLRLAVYNLRGQQIATLADDIFLPGEHRLTFDGSSHASGVYLIHLLGEDVSQTSKVLLLK